MTTTDVVDFLINLDDEFKETYWVYQELLYAFKKNNFDLLNKALHKQNNNIFSYMKTSIKTLLEFLPHINNNYHNGFVEGKKK